MSEIDMNTYQQRDMEALGAHYQHHIAAMTEEGLYRKADIAAELAHRDWVIAELTAARHKLASNALMAMEGAGIPTPERGFVTEPDGLRVCIKALVADRLFVRTEYRNLSSQFEAMQARAERAEATLAKFAAIGKQIAEQDNRGTSRPIFLVQQKVTDSGYDERYTDDVMWIDDDGSVADTDEKEKLEAAFQETGDIPDCWTRTGCRDRWEYVTACFTEQACKDHIAANGTTYASRIFTRIAATETLSFEDYGI